MRVLNEEEMALGGCQGPSCPLKCNDCDFCAQHMGCDCPYLVQPRSDSCLHVHLVGRFLKTAMGSWVLLPVGPLEDPVPAFDAVVANAPPDATRKARFQKSPVRCVKASAKDW